MTTLVARPQSRWASIAFYPLIAVCLVGFPQITWAQRTNTKTAQPPKTNTQSKSPQAAGKTKQPVDPKKGGTDTTGSDPAAVNYYADAANYQNNAAFSLAIEEWQKLLKEFPKDPLASKASHYLGVCYMQLETPDYSKAAAAFSRALSDKALDVREESLVNLGWCQFMQAREAEAGSAEQRRALEQARDTLSDVLRSYSQGAYVDQTLFYSGEIEFALNQPGKAIEYYDQLLKSKALAKSSLLADAKYAMGVAYEQLKKDAAAQGVYETFVAQHRDHRLANEVKLRLAEIYLRQGQPVQAEKLFSELSSVGDNPMADYAMLRLAQSLSEQSKLDQAADAYRSLVQKFPKSKHVPAAKLAAGQMYFRNGQWDAAIAEFKQAVSTKDAVAAEATHWYALSLLRKQAAAEAVELLKNALPWADSTPSALSLQMDMADALYDMPDRIDDARLAYEKIAANHADDPLAPRAAYNAAFAALQLGKLEDSRKWSETFLKKYPQDPLRNDVAYVASETMLQQGQHAGAIEGYRQLIASDSKNTAVPMWSLRLAMAYYLSSKYQDAVEFLGRQMSQFSDPRQLAEAHFIAGASYLFLDRADKAIESFTASTKATTSWTQADEVQLLLSQAYQRKGDNEAAERTLTDMIARYPQSRMRYQARYRLGQLQVAQKKFGEALASYEMILKEPAAQSLHDYAQYGVAYCAMQQEKWSDALSALAPLLDAKRTDSLSGEARLAEGLCLRKLGRLDAAIDALNQFLATQPSSVSLGNGLYELGIAQVEAKKFASAIDSFEKLRKVAVDYPAMDKVVLELAWAYSEQKETEKAASLFRELLEKHPESQYRGDALFELAQLEYEAKEFAKAAGSYRDAMKVATDDGLKEKAQYKLGWCLFQQDQFGDASREFQAQVKSFPKGKLAVDGHFMAAECLFKQDKFGDALAGYERAKQLLETQAAERDVSEQVRSLIYLHGAQCYREQKKWNDAETWLREIIKRYPNSPYLATVIYELATAKEKQNQVEEALKLYAEVATKYRDDVAARARFMMGELYFGQREFAKAVPEFQRVMYGYGADKAADAIKNWQARAGFEAGRCSEVLIQDLKGDQRTKAIALALEFYQYVVDKHPTHEVVKQAQVRMDELKKLR